MDVLLILTAMLALAVLLYRNWPRPEPPKNPCGFVPNA
jgi:hypothetical protein